MSHDHKITYYACGHIHSQCRCFSGDKLIETLPGLCPTCHTEEILGAMSSDAATPDSAKPTLEELRSRIVTYLDEGRCPQGRCDYCTEAVPALDAYAREVARRAATYVLVTRQPPKWVMDGCLRSLGLAEGGEE